MKTLFMYIRWRCCRSGLPANVQSFLQLGGSRFQGQHSCTPHRPQGPTSKVCEL
jgi:hypothetical protein